MIANWIEDVHDCSYILKRRDQRDGWCITHVVGVWLEHLAPSVTKIARMSSTVSTPCRKIKATHRLEHLIKPIRRETTCNKQSPCYLQRRTRTPSTHTVRQTTAGGRRTTTAPRAPAQPARYTPFAQTTAPASVVRITIVPENARTADAISRNERMANSQSCLV